MSITLGLVANIFNECNALPGWIETHRSCFDDIRVMHAGPQGQVSDDGTIGILENWRIPIAFMPIDDGFGAVRTAAIRSSPCDYVMLLDADERFYQSHRIMNCSGESTPQHEVDAILRTYDFSDLRKALPDWENVKRLGEKLCVTIGSAYDQGARLREILETERPDAVCSIRRHWHDFSFRRPTQNWHTDPDWQMRIVRNDPSIYFDPDTRMHERLVGACKVVRADMVRGPFFDHFHFTFKAMQQIQRAHNVAVYDKICKGEKPPTLEEYWKDV